MTSPPPPPSLKLFLSHICILIQHIRLRETKTPKQPLARLACPFSDCIFIFYFFNFFLSNDDRWCMRPISTQFEEIIMQYLNREWSFNRKVCNLYWTQNRGDGTVPWYLKRDPNQISITEPFDRNGIKLNKNITKNIKNTHKSIQQSFTRFLVLFVFNNV